MKDFNVPETTINVGIVPNAPICYDGKSYRNYPVGDCTEFYVMERFVERCVHANGFGIVPYKWNLETADNEIVGEGLEIKTSDVWVQVQLTAETAAGDRNITDGAIDPDSELFKAILDANTSSHSLLTNGRLYGLGMIPYKFLKDVKEGDTKVTYVSKFDEETMHYKPIHKIIWKFDQLNSRYHRFGKFEDVLASFGI